jgi:hypothetical protein
MYCSSCQIGEAVDHGLCAGCAADREAEAGFQWRVASDEGLVWFYLVLLPAAAAVIVALGWWLG